MRSHGNEDGHLPDGCARLQHNIEVRRVDAPSANDWLDDADLSHLSACSECAKFINFLQMMSTQRIVVDEDVQRRIIGSVNDIYFGKQKRSRLMFGAAVAVAGVAAILLTILWPGTPTPKSEEPVENRVVAVSALPSGAVETLWHGEARLFLTEGGEANILENTASALTIGIERGLLAVSVDPNRQNKGVLRVTAGPVHVTVTGTIFAVERLSGGVRVDVLRGRVKYKSDTERGDLLLLTAGRSWNTETQSETALEPERALKIRNLLGLPTVQDEPPVTTVKPPRASIPKKPSKGSLLAETRKCRIQKDWKCAEHYYNQLQRYYPQSAEAVTSHISLAQLRLNKLGVPKKALGDFRDYLRAMPSGPLAEEAYFGISTAYKKLGRRDEERRALETFVKKYPKSHLFAEAKKRLEKLSRNVSVEQFAD